MWKWGKDHGKTAFIGSSINSTMLFCNSLHKNTQTKQERELNIAEKTGRGALYEKTE